MIKAIFFDFDGTISDAKKIAFDSMVRVLDEFEFSYNEKKLRGLMGIKMPLILGELGLTKSVANSKSSVAQLRKKFYKYFTEAAVAGGIKPCVSLKPLWEMSKELPLIVISNSEGSFLRASIKKLELKGLFKAVYGAEKFNTKDKMLKKLFREMGIKASEAVYVGDRFSDIDYAREAGCVAVAIHNKCAWSSLARIKKEKPDYIVRDFRGLRKIVLELKKAK